ncbi:MAG: tetratricopeptide repeat protein [Nitrospina sp.]|nr:tetratricopeptide repeat protein [Nitrospina sp.]MBT4104488.1 tetratricopeptide repeat protein [Nitrospina sp.]MBT4388378.1 tetratricopeptide repeat protein [Nitrospina sp.]MBT4619882.1 tetratricopeptide repeat protein [Nitrospina sp.]MBT5956965.1 tetratricopeptide repeat protein [Nitrospina sp.]
MSSKSKNIESASSPLKRSLIMFSWLSVLAVGLWALMHYSTPESNLEPYNKFQEAKAEHENTARGNAEPAKAEPEKPEFKLPSDLDTGNLIKTATTMQPPQSQLPRETLEHIQKGMLLTEEGKYNAGDIEFEKASKISPYSPELFSIWGAALRMAKKFVGANKRFARAHELSPDDAEITFNWGMSEMEADHPKEAGHLFEKTIALAPKHYIAYNMLGKSYGRQKKYEEEMSAYKKALEINPSFAQAHFDLGIVLSIQKKFDSAAPHFLKAIELDKQFEKPFVIQMLTALGLYDPAAEKPIKKEKAPVQQAKVETPPETKKVSDDKKSEGSDSDHKMDEGSKKVKNTTTIKGSIQINGNKADANTLVFLETKNKLKVSSQKNQTLTISQKSLSFSPKHSVIQVGSSVTFSNEDVEVHNIFSKSLSNQFNLGAMASGSYKTVEFNQAGPVVLRCNMHKDMIGTLFVVPNGYYTRINADGGYQFENIKSDNYIMQVWNPMLAPEEVDANLRSADLTGVDQTFDFNIKSASIPGEIHDMVDPTDYNAIVDNIEREMFQAIEDWKNGKKFISRKRMLMAVTKHYAGEGLKGAIAKSFSSKRSILLEQKMDKIRKEISGYGKAGVEITETSLTSQAKFAVSQLRLNVKELEIRLKPAPAGH